MAADVVGAAAHRDAPPDSGVMERPKQAPKRCAECNRNASRREMIARRFGVGVAKRKFGETVQRIERWPADEVGGECRLTR